VARNALVLVLLMALALGGCSAFKGMKAAKEAEAKIVALRARTDSLRKARRLADSLAHIRHTACADSVRAGMSKPAVMAKLKKKRKRQSVSAPSEEMILTQVQAACGQGRAAPPPTVIAVIDSVKSLARVATAAPVIPAAAPPSAGAQPGSTLPLAQDAAWADSVRKAKEMEMSRETFAYSGASRDPFSSLLNMAKNGPELADLQLVGIYQNLRSPRGSVAVFREKDGGKRHKLRAGDQLGRSRLVQIRDRDVVFMIEDFGFERQETLSLRKQEDVTP
jgi:hypothetical protein